MKYRSNMEAFTLKTIVENNKSYIFYINGRNLKLDKDMVDKYSDLVCPIDERYLSYMIDVFDQDKCEDNALSLKIALDMTRELCGYER